MIGGRGGRGDDGDPSARREDDDDNNDENKDNNDRDDDGSPTIEASTLVCKRVSDNARATTNASDSRCTCRTMSQVCTHVGSSSLQGLRGSIPGGVEMRGKGDNGEHGRGGRGKISSVLGGALLSLVEL